MPAVDPAASASAAAKSCPKCQGRRFLIERSGELAQASVCSCTKPCPVCGDLGYVYAKTESTFSEKSGSRT